MSDRSSCCLFVAQCHQRLAAARVRLSVSLSLSLSLSLPIRDAVDSRARGVSLDTARALSDGRRASTYQSRVVDESIAAVVPAAVAIGRHRDGDRIGTERLWFKLALVVALGIVVVGTLLVVIVIGVVGDVAIELDVWIQRSVADCEPRRHERDRVERRRVLAVPRANDPRRTAQAARAV